MTHLNYLATITTIYKGFLKKKQQQQKKKKKKKKRKEKRSPSLWFKVKTFDQCSSCYTKFKQHFTKYLCVHNIIIIQCLVYKNIIALHLSAFSQKFPNCGLL